jgi:hypothetical protein
VYSLTGSSGEHRGGDCRAARLAEQQRRLRIHVDEDLLDRDLGRSIAGDDLGQVAQNDFEPQRELVVARAMHPHVT